LLLILFSEGQLDCARTLMLADHNPVKENGAHTRNCFI